MENLLETKLRKTFRTENVAHTFRNNDTFTGDVYQKQRNGYGVLQMNDGSFYKGNFKDGELDGEGEIWIQFLELSY